MCNVCAWALHMGGRTLHTPWYTERNHACDALRGLAFILLIFYHVGMLYVADWEWHFKSSFQSETLQIVMLWSNQWRMSLLFFIAGVASAYMFVRYRVRAYFLTRSAQLFWPLVFGMLVICAPQMYIEGKQQGLFTDTSFWQFWQVYLSSAWQSNERLEDGLAKVYLTWNHLWFLPYLLGYSLLCGSCMFVLKAFRQKGLAAPSFSSRSLVGLLVVLVVCLWCAIMLLYEHFPSTHDFVHDAYNHAKYGSVFVAGFMLARVPTFWQCLAKSRLPLLIAACTSFVYVACDFRFGVLPDSATGIALSRLLWATNHWLWIFSVLAWAVHATAYWKNQGKQWVTWLNARVFYCYILHQTLIIIAAYSLSPHVSSWPAAVLWEPVLIILFTFTVCFATYPWVRQVPILRYLLGIHVKP